MELGLMTCAPLLKDLALGGAAPELRRRRGEPKMGRRRRRKRRRERRRRDRNAPFKTRT